MIFEPFKPRLQDGPTMRFLDALSNPLLRNFTRSFSNGKQTRAIPWSTPTSSSSSSTTPPSMGSTLLLQFVAKSLLTTQEPGNSNQMEPTNTSHSHYAYPENPDLEVIMRLAAVKRWHMIDTTRIQNLAEHTAIVSLLAWQIAHKCPGMYFPPLEAMLYAMVHDLAEAFTGDVPSHTKKLIGKENVSKIEDSLLPVSFKLEECSMKVKDLIKLCDLAEGIRFIRLHGVDLTAGHAQEGLEEQYNRLEAKVLDEWPAIVHQHVSDILYFFRYETDRI